MLQYCVSGRNKLYKLFRNTFWSLWHQTQVYLSNQSCYIITKLLICKDTTNQIWHLQQYINFGRGQEEVFKMSFRNSQLLLLTMWQKGGEEHCIVLCTVNGSIGPSVRTVMDESWGGARLTGINVVVSQQVHPPSPTILLPCNML